MTPMTSTIPSPTIPSPTIPTTTALLHAAAGGDDHAWQELVRRFEPAVAAVVRGYRLQEADARDAIQRTWLQLLEHHREVREPEALAGWLRTTAKRECLRIRSERRWDHAGDPALAEAADPRVDVERDVVDADLVRRVRRLMDELPSRCVALLDSLFQDDPPAYAQLARETGIPIGSIGPTRARALRKLRRLIEDDSAGFRRGA